MEISFFTGFTLIFMVFIIIGFIFLSIKLLGAMQKQEHNKIDFERFERMARNDASQLRQELGQSLLQFNQAIRSTVEERFDKMSTDNAQKLEKMRETVDEKLHTTLEKRLGDSFAQVSERLEKVHQGLGEMQNLAADVGGLKRVLTNVKTRGTWGEVQLGSLLEQILSPEQFIKNAHVQKNSAEVVEFAVKLPDNGVLIAIDSKFPIEDYERLIVASDKADVVALELASKELEKKIKLEAKRISDKYINPPITTDFAIMFLPTEGLYAEIMKRAGLASEIQQKYRILIAGPNTLGAFLNSLQMGFRSLIIQKRSGEVWKVLNEAKTEFEKYNIWVEKARKNLETLNNTFNNADTRTKAIQRKLKDVETNISPEPTETLETIPAQLLTSV